MAKFIVCDIAVKWGGRVYQPGQTFEVDERVRANKVALETLIESGAARRAPATKQPGDKAA